MRLLTAVAVTLQLVVAQNKCPLHTNTTGVRWCGNSVCFHGAFGTPMVLQRAPERAAVYGATGVPAQAGVPMTLTVTGTLDDNSTYNKSFATASMPDGTWK